MRGSGQDNQFRSLQSLANVLGGANTLGNRRTDQVSRICVRVIYGNNNCGIARPNSYVVAGPRRHDCQPGSPVTCSDDGDAHSLFERRLCLLLCASSVSSVALWWLLAYPPQRSKDYKG